MSFDKSRMNNISCLVSIELDTTLANKWEREIQVCRQILGEEFEGSY